MDRKSREYVPVMHEDYPNESQPLTKHRRSSLSETDADDDFVPSEDCSKSPASSCKYTVVAVLLAVACNIASGCFGFYYGKQNLDAACSSYTTQYSPVLKEVEIKYDFVHYNGSFLEETIYRQRASPEVDDAWEALGVNSRAGRADKYGGGFFVNVEGMHHLHCLNLVRQGLYYNFDYYKKLGTGAFVNGDMIIEKHIYTIRQTLMCNPDTGVLGQVWFDQDSPTAFPDFNTKHKCKNFDDISRWAIENQEPLPGALPDDYMKEPRPEYVGENTP
ncbi:putative tat pathway signal sequence [Diaporthe ampelina]|uniref:Putative tat pathway signal sequence n=1 Tax=Diaporthe ampelina TaxID=1214573 RepID=A0A0G2F8A8_9PEZI|nr:putative tat pathway signal sequence [Diaporthe ampelina]